MYLCSESFFDTNVAILIIVLKMIFIYLNRLIAFYLRCTKINYLLDLHFQTIISLDKVILA